MEYTQTLSLIQTVLSEYGLAVLAIITATLVLGVAYLVMHFGWSSVKSSLDGGVNRRLDGTYLPKGFSRKGEDYFQDGEKLPF